MSLPIISIEGFISWIERQDLDQTYDYGNAQDCIIQRYLIARGYDSIDPKGFSPNDLREMGFNEVAHGGDVSFHQTPYRNALLVAKEQLAKRTA